MAADSSDRRDGDSSGSLPAPNIASPPKPSLHPAVYVAYVFNLLNRNLGVNVRLLAEYGLV